MRKLMQSDEKLQCFYLTEWVQLVQTTECAHFNFSQRNYIVYIHLLSRVGEKMLSIMRWQLIARLQHYPDFAVLELRVQRYRVECCAEKLCSSGVLSAIPESPGPWLILCACLLWQPAFPQPGADSIHFLFLRTVAQSIVTLKGLGKQDQSFQSSCLTNPTSPHTVCAPPLNLCCSVKL